MFYDILLIIFYKRQLIRRMFPFSSLEHQLKKKTPPSGTANNTQAVKPDQSLDNPAIFYSSPILITLFLFNLCLYLGIRMRKIMKRYKIELLTIAKKYKEDYV